MAQSCWFGRLDFTFWALAENSPQTQFRLAEHPRHPPVGLRPVSIIVYLCLGAASCRGPNPERTREVGCSNGCRMVDLRPYSPAKPRSASGQRSCRRGWRL